MAGIVTCNTSYSQAPNGALCCPLTALIFIGIRKFESQKSHFALGSDIWYVVVGKGTRMFCCLSFLRRFIFHFSTFINNLPANLPLFKTWNGIDWGGGDICSIP